MKEKAIYFFSEEVSYVFRDKNRIRKWIAHAIVSENYGVGVVNFIFSSDNFLHKTNLKYLQHDTYTDIITFDYNNNDVVIGEIFISLDRVLENSTKLHTDFKDEYYRILIHGLLHLLGYKDKKKSDKILMTQKEDYYLSLLPSFI